MGEFFPWCMSPAWGGGTVCMYFHELVCSLFPIAIGIVVYSLLFCSALIANGSPLFPFPFFSISTLPFLYKHFGHP